MPTFSAAAIYITIKKYHHRRMSDNYISMIQLTTDDHWSLLQVDVYMHGLTMNTLTLYPGKIDIRQGA